MTRDPAHIERFVRSMDELQCVVYLGKRGWRWDSYRGRRWWAHPDRPGRYESLAVAIRLVVAEEMGIDWPPRVAAPPKLRIVGCGPEHPAS